MFIEFDITNISKAVMHVFVFIFPDRKLPLYNSSGLCSLESTYTILKLEILKCSSIIIVSINHYCYISYTYLLPC